jgi:hypothetical protein
MYERPGRRRIDAGWEMGGYQDAHAVWGESISVARGYGARGEEPRSSLNPDLPRECAGLHAEKASRNQRRIAQIRSCRLKL